MFFASCEILPRDVSKFINAILLFKHEMCSVGSRVLSCLDLIWLGYSYCTSARQYGTFDISLARAALCLRRSRQYPYNIFYSEYTIIHTPVHVDPIFCWSWHPKICWSAWDSSTCRFGLWVVHITHNVVLVSTISHTLLNPRKARQADDQEKEHGINQEENQSSERRSYQLFVIPFRCLDAMGGRIVYKGNYIYPFRYYDSHDWWLLHSLSVEF